MVVIPIGPNSAGSPMWITVFRSVVFSPCASAQPAHKTKATPALSMFAPFRELIFRNVCLLEPRGRCRPVLPVNRLRPWRSSEWLEARHQGGPVLLLDPGPVRYRDLPAEHHSARKAKEQI